jgi:hypothetical protein
MTRSTPERRKVIVKPEAIVRAKQLRVIDPRSARAAELPPGFGVWQSGSGDTAFVRASGFQ